METLDERSDKLPNEAIVEIKSMCKWMTFSGVMIIIFGLLGILGSLGDLGKSGKVVITVLVQVASVIMAFVLITKSSAFNRYAEMRNEVDLAKALRSNQLYWMVSTIVTIISFVLNILIQ